MNNGLSILSVLQIVFVVLKLTNLVSWSWVTVLMPSWLPIAVVTSIFLLILLIWGLQKISRRFFVYTLKVKDRLEDVGITL